MTSKSKYESTPDGRYMVVRGRLWRLSNPNLNPDQRQEFVNRLMDARRAVKAALKSGDPAELRAARAAVDSAKHDLGERGPVWWTDGTPDLNRKLITSTHYADWYAAMEPSPL